jgi:L-threonylcarbamoyladenylate synthase
MVELIARQIDQRAQLLMARFWPGPLTLVLERNPGVAQTASAGLNTIAVRMPKNAVALQLIETARTPIAAPSANTSGRPSPTSAEHVARDLGGKIEIILDGGITNIGIESTVLDLTADPPAILRPGWITREMIAELIGRVETAASGEKLKRSPGTRYRHYSPRARLILIEATASESINQVCSRMLERGTIGFIGHTRPSIGDPNLLSIILADNPEDYARSIYAALRELDQRGTAAIVVEGIDDAGQGAAVMDRLRRAASEIITAAREN